MNQYSLQVTSICFSLLLVLKLGLVRDPADPGLEPGRVEEKIEKGKIQRDPAKPGQKTGCDSLTFTFLLKQYYFDLKKKKIDPVKTRVLDRADHQDRSENYSIANHISKQNIYISN